MSTPLYVLLAVASARKLFHVGTLSCFILGFVGCSKQSNNVVVSKAATEPTALTNSSKIRGSESTDSPTKAAHQGVTFYSVDHYDASRNPATDLAETVRRATKEKKRILIQVGGDWCSPCRLMTALMETNSVVRETISNSFIVASVKAITVWDEQGNEKQVLQLKPEIPADHDSPNEFSIHFSADVRATFKRIGIDDVTKHFAGKVVEVQGPVAAIRYESQSLRKITWAYHVEIKSLEQILRVEATSQTEKPYAVNPKR